MEYSNRIEYRMNERISRIEWTRTFLQLDVVPQKAFGGTMPVLSMNDMLLLAFRWRPLISDRFPVKGSRAPIPTTR